jgi:putrescine transport system ATP-binding protein
MNDQPAPAIELRAVSRHYGDVAAVDRVSLSVAPGEIFCLLGASGSGKTTLLRLLAGFEQAGSGEIRIAGEVMNAVPPYRRPVNLMFQQYALFPHLSVERNVAYGLHREGLPAKEVRARVDEMLGRVGLRGYERRLPQQLSGGQQQRVALARALVKRPRVLLLDEPLGALDKRLREQTQFELVNLQESLGLTFLVVTHDQEEAMRLGSRIGVMDRGRIVQTGTPHEVYERPANRFVAGFLGSVNLIELIAQPAAADGSLFTAPELGCQVQVTAKAADRRPGSVALRPEKVELKRVGPEVSTAPNSVQGTVEEIAYLGDTTHYLVRTTSGVTLRSTCLNSHRGVGEALQWGETVHCSWAVDALVPLAG